MTVRLADDPAALLFARGRALAESAEAADPGEQKWIHLASEGDYAGHAMGPFALDRPVFESFVANFRRDPRYKAGADGVGCSPVLPFDYEHASEMFPADGSIPSGGAPAAAWACELQLRDAADGTAQLWGLARLGQQIRGQIARGEYRFVSIAFVPESNDWETGEARGPALTSVAFTNQPFLRDLQPLAARARPAAARPASTDRDSSPGTAVRSGASGPQQEHPMDPKFIALVAKLLAGARLKGVRTLQSEADVEAAITEAAQGSGDLQTLLEALGVEDAEAALKAIPALKEASEKLTAMKAKLDQLMAAEAAHEQEMAKAEVEAALSAHFADKEQRDRARPALVALRATGREPFAKAYPLPEPAKQALLSTLVSSGGGTQHQPPLPLSQRADGGDGIDLRAYPGNMTERLQQYILATIPAAKNWPKEQLLIHCAQLRRNPNVSIRS